MLSSDHSTTLAGEAELVPANCFAPVDFEQIYRRRAPVEVDLGCGDGSFLAAIAAENPSADFLGIEGLAGRVRATCRRIERGGLTNARVLRFELSYAIQRLVPGNSVTVFHLMFPDPWPKRRHARRRLVNENFLGLLHRALVPNGTVRIATDETDYFRQISGLTSDSPLFTTIADSAPACAMSKFERRFTQEGINIHRLVLRKVSPVT
ncbi:MAG TPA: tRNA (guanosine(46)-N7)-methyltransferase TrmB [Chthoniobacterales bacterium]|nr:tRNA (guanosine(46)-N7)-methyltransferase TrmB [Chthoniobacterales bacterium]